MTQELHQLLLKYYGPGGRYGIYPGLSHWQSNLQTGQWMSHVKDNYSPEEGVDLYIHIPFCESLCTFCGCNIKVTRDHSEENTYINKLLSEWAEYKNKIKTPVIRSIYIGGGTPSYLSIDSLNFLLEGLLKDVSLHHDFHGTFEADPRSLNKDQVKAIKKFGFDRVSLGVQDFNQKVLDNVNRSQSLEIVKQNTTMIRAEGINEVFYDLIYGLPYQTKDSFNDTIDKLKELNPDGLSLYPLAHVPWQKKAQKAFGIYEPLNINEKISLFISANDKINKMNYQALGMNTYVQTDSVFINKKKKKELKRTVMGFMSSRSNILIGLGVSAISHTPTSMIQNEKIYSKYLNASHLNNSIYFKSHLKTNREKLLLPIFEKLICNSFLSKSDLEELDLWNKTIEIFIKLEQDGLVEVKKEGLYVRPLGIYFFKNICQIIERASLS